MYNIYILHFINLSDAFVYKGVKELGVAFTANRRKDIFNLRSDDAQ